MATLRNIILFNTISLFLSNKSTHLSILLKLILFLIKFYMHVCFPPFVACKLSSLWSFLPRHCLSSNSLVEFGEHLFSLCRCSRVSSWIATPEGLPRGPKLFIISTSLAPGWLGGHHRSWIIQYRLTRHLWNLDAFGFSLLFLSFFFFFYYFTFLINIPIRQKKKKIRWGFDLRYLANFNFTPSFVKGYFENFDIFFLIKIRRMIRI